MWRHVALNSKAAEDQLAAYQNAIEALEVCIYYKGGEMRNFSSSVEMIQHSNRSFVSPGNHVIFLRRHISNNIFDDFPKISDHFPKISQ